VLKKLWIKGFRNFSEVHFDFSEKRHCFIYGENNQGKSNLLEAISVLSSGKSPRESVVRYLVGFDHSEALIGGDFVSSSGVNRVYFKLSSEGVRSSFLNQEIVKSYTKLSRELSSVYLSADLIRIFQDSPSERRKFLDMFCSLYFHDYLATMKKYERVVAQKNRLLKSEVSDDSFVLWNRQLCDLAYVIYDLRLRGLELLSSRVNELLGHIPALSEGRVSLRYDIKSFKCDLLNYKAVLYETISSNLYKERASGCSLYGPHRDDFVIYIGDLESMRFFSRGINRVLSILLYVSHLLLVFEHKGQFPILLLDDVFVELDEGMKRSLISLLCGYTQVFYVSVNESDRHYFDECAVIRLMKGVLTDG
jgi:DNA replication and repair protein RecF